MHFSIKPSLIVLLCLSLAHSAAAAILGEAELRSYLGAPVDIRIPITPTTNEALETGCFSLPLQRAGSDYLSSRDVRISLFETRTLTYLQLQGNAPSNEPVIQFRLRAGCGDANALFKDYVLLLDPPPLNAVPASTATANMLAAEAPATATGSANSSLVPATTATEASSALPPRINWIAVQGDTLHLMASGIFPGSSRLRKEFIAGTRALNPALASTPENQVLDPGISIMLPDLRKLAQASIATRSAAKNTRSSAGTANGLSAPPAAQPARQPAANSPNTNTLPARKASGAQKTQRTARNGGNFQLKLSTADIDLSFSRDITEAQRTALREKQLLLDADDQVAAMLAMKNTVHQLENRLNEMQLKLANMPGPPATLVATATPPVSAATPATAPTATPASAPVTAAPATTPNQTATPIPKKIAGPAAPASSFWSTPWYYWCIPLGLIVLIIWWMRSQQRETNIEEEVFASVLTQPRLDILKPARIETAVPAPAVAPVATSKIDDNFVTEIDMEFGLPHDEFALPKFPGTEDDPETYTDTMVLPGKIASAPAQSTAPELDLPAIKYSPDQPASTDSFRLDDAPTTHVDFLVDADADKSPDDRIRRRSFMQGRYPELATGAVSLDVPDTIINAARHYFEDGVHDKAQELLTFSLEERPQEMRLWLAQFEIYRRLNLAQEYSHLADKFHILFGDCTEWKKICHIGFSLDAGNKYFMESMYSADAITHLDPASENWLNDHRNAALISLAGEFRNALLTQYRVTESELAPAAEMAVA